MANRYTSRARRSPAPRRKSYGRRTSSARSVRGASRGGARGQTLNIVLHQAPPEGMRVGQGQVVALPPKRVL